ncbi:MAG: hypothetical protein OXC41_02675 [Gammaproteobacteria bacterium]|nr:hypothetical protein [Gammaproteobacteria bacterium]
MSGLLIFFLIIGAAATALYAAGYVTGIRQSFADVEEDKEIAEYKDSAYTVTIALAVIASAVIIGLVGVNPIFVYAGPLLAVITTFMVGFAFFFERMMRASGNY